MASSLSTLSACWLATWHQECSCLCLQDNQDLVLAPGVCHGWMTTIPISIPQGFKQAIPSWNLLQAEGTSYRVLFRACRANGCWTPWFTNEPSPATGEKQECLDVRWEMDQLLSDETLTHFQLGVHLNRESANQPSPALRALYLAAFRPSRNGPALPSRPPEPVAPIPHPFTFQYLLDPLIGGVICSPTSVSVVLRGAGIDVEPLKVAQLAYHAGYGIYGVWPMAVHAAYQLGMNGWVQYISGWSQAVRYLRRGVPLVTSIAFKGEDLKEPPYPGTEGHLLVLLGVDEKGCPITHDSRLPEERGAYLHWNPDDFSKAWFSHGGVAYVFPSRRE